MSTITNYVVQGGQSITAGQVAAFRSHLAVYKLKVETLEAVGQPLLRGQCTFLLRFIEDVLDDVYFAEDFSALPEAVFAVRYVVREADIIPDNVSGGFSDDAEVLRVVLAGHGEEFRKYCLQNGLDFDALAGNP